MLLKPLGLFLAWTWPLWEFLFVYCLVGAIIRGIQEAGDGQDRRSGEYTFWAALSFAIILSGTLSLLVMVA